MAPGKSGRKIGCGIVTLAVLAGAARADDKGSFTLAKPTPDHLLRDMTTDRPDTTESPFTVDAGRVQIETSLFGYARSRADATARVVDTYEFGTTNIRVGLASNAEVNVVWQPYGIVRGHHYDPLLRVRESGIGSMDIRAKVNLWGNDGFDKPGDTALAILPYVTLPTDRRNGISAEHVDAGVIVPFAIHLTDRLGLGLNAGATFAKDEDRGGYDTAYIATASLAYEWNDRLGTYYEIAIEFAGDDGDIVVLGTGLTYALNDNLQLDAGINFGVTPASDRINPFVGIASRF